MAARAPQNLAVTPRRQVVPHEGIADRLVVDCLVDFPEECRENDENQTAFPVAALLERPHFLPWQT